MASSPALSPTSQGKGGGNGGNSQLNRSFSGSILKKSGELSLGQQETLTKYSPPPKVPQYLSVHALTRRRKLSASSGNLHGCMADDYSRINWPLPKMFGEEKYAYSLIDITDPRCTRECAAMSKQLIRLAYDQQIMELEWRKTYKRMLLAEHRLRTLPETAPQKTVDSHKKEIENHNKYLLELQQQKDMYEKEVTDIYAHCDEIKLALKKESDLEDLRMYMEGVTKDRVEAGSPFWSAKFNIHLASSSPK